MKPISYGSVCSGIEAATVAVHPLGWVASWLAEIEPFPSAVLAHHYPAVKNLGDMTKIASRVMAGDVDAPDVLVGGTPCQAFSVAGMRNGLADARGALTISFVELANAIDATRSVRGLPPSVVWWENVPGVLSSKDNAFGCFLGALAGESCELQPPGGRWKDAGCVLGPQRAVAWRILDAQYFGVAQRRRRVFVVASARDGFDPVEILFEFEGLRRDTAPIREAWQKLAPTIAGCANGGGANGPGRDVDSCETLQVVAGALRSTDGGVCVDHARANQIITMAHGQGGAEIGFDRGPTLTCNHEAPIAAYSTAGPTEFLPQSSRVYMENGVSPTLQGVGTRNGQRTPAVCVTGQVTHTLKAEGFDASEDGTGSGQPIVVHGTQDPDICIDHAHPLGRNSGQENAIAFAQNSRDEVRLQGGDGQIVGALAAEPGMKQTTYVAVPPEPTFTLAIRGRGDSHNLEYRTDGTANALLTPNGGRAGIGVGAISHAMQVRRLTPRECERLQGFPDDYTLITVRGKPAADGPRYKALGNSMAVPNMRWIGERIDASLRALSGSISAPAVMEGEAA